MTEWNLNSGGKSVPHAYMKHDQQPHGLIRMAPCQAIAGSAIGILVLDLWYPLMPGNVANASTYGYPVTYKVMRGTTISMIHSADPKLLDQIVQGGKELISNGVRAIVGACGYFANYQKEAAPLLDVPLFLSSMLQVPMIKMGLKPGQKVGIICASESALTDRALEGCGIYDRSSIAVTGAQDIPDFKAILECKGEFNSQRLESDLADLAESFVRQNPDIGAILLECSDMPPYSCTIQNRVGLPVFDFITMIDWIQHAVVRKPFYGFI